MIVYESYAHFKSDAIINSKKLKINYINWSSDILFIYQTLLCLIILILILWILITMISILLMYLIIL